jgi:hypothetical protein
MWYWDCGDVSEGNFETAVVGLADGVLFLSGRLLSSVAGQSSSLAGHRERNIFKRAVYYYLLYPGRVHFDKRRTGVGIQNSLQLMEHEGEDQ